MNLKVYNNPEEIAEVISYKLLAEIKIKVDLAEKYYLAVSGGTTPKLLFEKLSKSPFKEDILWQFLHIYWVDERCVPPANNESNFGMTKKILLDNVNIPIQNIHRIKGEDNPGKEIYRYASEIKQSVPLRLGLPAFDRILLGMGSDGHTASLFPRKNLIETAEDICGVAIHPDSGQNRISLTQSVINNALNVTFMVTGKDKADTLLKIVNRQDGFDYFPAAGINPVFGNLEWIVDRQAYTS
jgi:6-phosphogluconolactonase